MTRFGRKDRQARTSAPDPAQDAGKHAASAVGPSLHPFLSPAGVVPRGALDGAPEVIPGLFLTTAVWSQDRVDFLPAASAGPLGGAEAARAQAMANVRRLPAAQVEAMDATPGRPDSRVWVARYDDPFGAGRIGEIGVVLSDLVAAGLAQRDIQISRGLLVAAPTWHIVLVHLLLGPGVLTAMKLMAQATVGTYDEGPRERRVSNKLFFKSAASRFGESPPFPPQVVGYPDPNGEIVLETRGAIGEVLFGVRGLLGTNRP